MNTILSSGPDEPKHQVSTKAGEAQPVAGKLGRPRQHDHDKYRRLLWVRGIKPAPRYDWLERLLRHGPLTV